MLGRGKHSSKTSHKNFMYYDVTLGFFMHSMTPRSRNYISQPTPLLQNPHFWL